MSESEEKKTSPMDDAMNQEWEPYVAKSMVESEAEKQGQLQEALKEVGPKGKKLGDKISIVFCIILAIGIAAWNLSSAIYKLGVAKTHDISEVFAEPIKGHIYSGEVNYVSSEYCSLKHSVNFIPAGVEHYFLIYSDDLNHVISVRADKNWVKEGEEELWKILKRSGKGILRRMDAEVRGSLETLEAYFAEAEIEVDKEYYIDFLSLRFSIIELVAGIGMLLTLILVALVMRNSKRLDLMKQKATTANAVLSIVCAVVLISTCMTELYLVLMLL